MYRKYTNKVIALLLIFLITPTTILKIAIIGVDTNLYSIAWTFFTSVAAIVIICLLIKRTIEHEIVYVREMRNIKGMDDELLSKIDNLLEQSAAYQKILVENDIAISSEKQRASIIEHELNIATNISDSLMDLTTEFILKIDREGNILKINKSFINRLGYQVTDVIGENIKNLIDVDQADSSVTDNQFIARLIQENKQAILLAFKIKTISGFAREHIGITTYENKDGTILCIGKAINDEIALQSNILRKNRELEYINQINASLVSNWDIDTLLDNIIKRIDYLFNIKFGCIHIYDEMNRWVLKSFASKHYKYEELDNHYLEEAFINVEAQIKTYNVDQALMKYLIVSPLIVDDKPIAIISIGLDQEMSTNDLNILKMFKNQTAMVIQRALIYDQLRGHYLGTIEALVNVIEAKDKYTEGHSRRVSRFSVEIAKEMGYSNEEVENIEIAGLLHDIGKIGIDYGILTKRGKLTLEEYEIIKTHPTKGAKILEAISLDPKIKDAILYHHLRYDLTGYPNASLDTLPIYACIIGTADAFDAITSARSYNRARSMHDAIEELERYEGSQFDPKMVKIFQKLYREKPEVLKRIIDDTDF